MVTIPAILQTTYPFSVSGSAQNHCLLELVYCSYWKCFFMTMWWRKLKYDCKNERLWENNQMPGKIITWMPGRYFCCWAGCLHDIVGTHGGCCSMGYSHQLPLHSYVTQQLRQRDALSIERDCHVIVMCCNDTESNSIYVITWAKWLLLLLCGTAGQGNTWVTIETIWNRHYC